jgi:hypothetical protein
LKCWLDSYVSLLLDSWLSFNIGLLLDCIGLNLVGKRLADKIGLVGICLMFDCWLDCNIGLLFDCWLDCNIGLLFDCWLDCFNNLFAKNI